MYEIDFSDMQSLDKRCQVENSKVVALVESGTQVLYCHFLVPVPWKVGAKMRTGIYASAFKWLHHFKHKLEAMRTRILWKGRSKEKILQQCHRISQGTIIGFGIICSRPQWLAPESRKHRL